jgi:hypothetical protein
MKKEYGFERLREVKNPYAGKKKAVGINLSPEVLDYFKGLAGGDRAGVSDADSCICWICARKRKKLNLNRVA